MLMVQLREYQSFWLKNPNIAGIDATFHEMPSADKPSFRISQTFFCKGCRNQWSSFLSLPLAEGSYDVTVETALKRTLYASNCVLFNGNITLEDLNLDSRLLYSLVSSHQGEMEVTCKSAISSRMCPECVYPSDLPAHTSSVTRPSSSRQSKYTIVIESLRSEPAAPTSVCTGGTLACPPNMCTIASPLSENPPEISNMEDGESSIISGITLQNSPFSRLISTPPPTSVPIPAPRSATRSTISRSEHSSQTFQPDPEGQGEADGELNTSADDNVYLLPSLRPPLPPKPWNPLLNVFTCTPAPIIKDVLAKLKVQGYYALVKTPPVEGNSRGKMETPYLIFCPQLKDGYKPIFGFKTPIGVQKYFIHRDQTFETIKGLLVYYRHHPTKCKALFLTQLTVGDLDRYIQGDGKFHLIAP